MEFDLCAYYQPNLNEILVGLLLIHLLSSVESASRYHVCRQVPFVHRDNLARLGTLNQ